MQGSVEAVSSRGPNHGDKAPCGFPLFLGRAVEVGVLWSDVFVVVVDAPPPANTENSSNYDTNVIAVVIQRKGFIFL